MTDRARYLVEARGITRAVTMGNDESLTVLNDVDLLVRSGESTAIVGRSGSGKTSLLSVLGLLSRPDVGTLRVDGEDVLAASETRRASIRNQLFGFVFQSYSLVPHLTVAENVALPLGYGTRISGRERRVAVEELLESVGLAHRHKDRPKHLSGGEQQRVAVARALVRRPNIVLADEPTGALDTDTADVVLDLLYSVTRARGAALVIVTHDQTVAQRADRRLTMHGGRLAESEVVHEPVMAVAR